MTGALAAVVGRTYLPTEPDIESARDGRRPPCLRAGPGRSLARVADLKIGASAPFSDSEVNGRSGFAGNDGDEGGLVILGPCRQGGPQDDDTRGRSRAGTQR
jgi:hypothetical protein